MPRKSTLNGRAARVAGASPSQVTRTQKSGRKTPGNADPKEVQKFIDGLEASIARHNGNVDMPQGITIQNTVIARIIRDGVPEALSREKRKWIEDEYDLVRCTLTWPHGLIAAYLGRSAQACRLARLRLQRRARRATRATRATRGSTQQDTEATQDEPPQDPPAVSSASAVSSVPSDPSDPSAPSASSASSGSPSLSATTQRFDQVYQMPIVTSANWRQFAPAPKEPGASTTLDKQAAAVKDSAPASHVISGPGLDILASAAAQVEQNRAPYQHALSVMGHDVD